MKLEVNWTLECCFYICSIFLYCYLSL